MGVRRFAMISEVEARQIEAGTSIELEAGGHVTPLAADTLRERRIAVVRLGRTDASLPGDLAPVAAIRRVAIASDHTGGALKAALISHLRRQGMTVEDVWPEATGSIDYPDTAAAVGRAVARGQADAGIVIDGAGLGSAIAANKIRGIRAAMCTSVTLARYAREHNGANVLALGSTLVDEAAAIAIVETWVTTPMTEARYVRRLIKVGRLEEAF